MHTPIPTTAQSEPPRPPVSSLDHPGARTGTDLECSLCKPTLVAPPLAAEPPVGVPPSVGKIAASTPVVAFVAVAVAVVAVAVAANAAAVAEGEHFETVAAVGQVEAVGQAVKAEQVGYGLAWASVVIGPRGPLVGTALTVKDRDKARY